MKPKNNTPREPFPTALAMLARRPYSVAELRRALQRKCPAHVGIEDAIARLRSLGYLDDRKFAEQMASSLARNRAFGRHRIRRELKAKLVDYRHIAPAIERAFEESDERELLNRAIDRKVRTMKLPITQRKLQSLCQSLLRRGFSSGDIMKAVR
ncbi:MAG: regulatory protein RecX, partial [Deltaproteobacteria bacterium]